MTRAHLTGEQHQNLRLRARHELGRVSERIHFILLSDRGYSSPEVADLLFGYCETIVPE